MLLNDLKRSCSTTPVCLAWEADVQRDPEKSRQGYWPSMSGMLGTKLQGLIPGELCTMTLHHIDTVTGSPYLEPPALSFQMIGMALLGLLKGSQLDDPLNKTP